MPYGSHNLGNNSKPLFEDRTGLGLDPVGGEFQPSFETGYASGGAHLIFVLKDKLFFSCDSNGVHSIADF